MIVYMFISCCISINCTFLSDNISVVCSLGIHLYLLVVRLFYTRLVLCAYRDLLLAVSYVPVVLDLTRYGYMASYGALIAPWARYGTLFDCTITCRRLITYELPRFCLPVSPRDVGGFDFLKIWCVRRSDASTNSGGLVEMSELPFFTFLILWGNWNTFLIP